MKPPQKNTRRPVVQLVRGWASSQVATYRVSLVLGYLAMMYFGGSAFVAGIPVFQLTTPDPASFNVVWSSIVIVGGLVAGIGAIRAGTEPVTREVRVFNRIELVGSTLLFVTLFTYAGLLLTLGYTQGDNGRATVGAGFVALGIHPFIRMLWLTFRPRFLKLAPKVVTGPMVVIPQGHAVFAIDSDGKPLHIIPLPAGDRVVKAVA